MKNQKLMIGLLVALLCALLDVFVVVGWFFSPLLFFVSFYKWLNNFLKNREKSYFIIYSIFSIILTFCLSFFVEEKIRSDILFLENMPKTFLPRTRQDIGDNNNISKVTKLMILGYVGRDDDFSIRFRYFPYKIMDYDFLNKKEVIRDYD